MGNICFLLLAQAMSPASDFPSAVIISITMAGTSPCSHRCHPWPHFPAERSFEVIPLEQFGSRHPQDPSQPRVCDPFPSKPQPLVFGHLTERDEDKTETFNSFTSLFILPGAPGWRILTQGVIRQQLALKLYRICCCH